MAREHRLTHPQIGPVSWAALQDHVIALRKTLGRKACWWCFGEVPKGRRTQCGSEECERFISAISSWGTSRNRFMCKNRKCVLCGVFADQCDHIIPVCMGGTSDPHNLRPLCDQCHKGETKRLRQLKDAYVARVKA